MAALILEELRRGTRKMASSVKLCHSNSLGGRREIQEMSREVKICQKRPRDVQEKLSEIKRGTIEVIIGQERSRELREVQESHKEELG